MAPVIDILLNMTVIGSPGIRRGIKKLAVIATKTVIIYGINLLPIYLIYLIKAGIIALSLKIDVGLRLIPSPLNALARREGIGRWAFYLLHPCRFKV